MTAETKERMKPALHPSSKFIGTLNTRRQFVHRTDKGFPNNHTRDSIRNVIVEAAILGVTVSLERSELSKRPP